MSFYDSSENVESYIKMAEGYDGREVIAVLKEHLKAGSTVLELGMGPGIDFEILGETYNVTGSDYSERFLERYLKKNPEADLVQLDAAAMDIKRRFDCIYSNKVLHHLTHSALEKSLNHQLAALNPGGFLCHTFWAGEKEEEIHGLRFVYYTETALANLLPSGCDTVVMEHYTEMDENDSIQWLIRVSG